MARTAAQWRHLPVSSLTFSKAREASEAYFANMHSDLRRHDCGRQCDREPAREKVPDFGRSRLNLSGRRSAIAN